MISKDENKGGELARIPRAARKKRVSGVDILSLVAGSPSPETRGSYRGHGLRGDTMPTVGRGSGTGTCDPGVTHSHAGRGV